MVSPLIPTAELAATIDDAGYQKYFDNFDPDLYDPKEWARRAREAGMKYVVFTAKHHSGFCMFDTKTTPFNVMNTPLKRDITKELIEAFRKEGIAIGLYFSPEDFYFFHKTHSVS